MVKPPGPTCASEAILRIPPPVATPPIDEEDGSWNSAVPAKCVACPGGPMPRNSPAVQPPTKSPPSPSVAAPSDAEPRPQYIVGFGAPVAPAPEAALKMIAPGPT